MRTARHNPSSRPAGGFTLVEMIIAISIMAILIFSIHVAFLAALQLRNRTVEAIETSLPTEDALQIIQRNLANLVISTNTNAIFLAPLRTVNQTNVLPGQIGPDFYTSRGQLDGMVQWGVVEKIDYLLTPRTNGLGAGPGQDLVRAVTHNLLSTTQPPQPEERQALLGGVQSLTFLYYDGAQWDTMWDTTQQTNLPLAIKVQIQMMPTPGALAFNTPLELVVPIDTLLNTNPISSIQ